MCCFKKKSNLPDDSTKYINVLAQKQVGITWHDIKAQKYKIHTYVSIKTILLKPQNIYAGTE